MSDYERISSVLAFDVECRGVAFVRQGKAWGWLSFLWANLFRREQPLGIQPEVRKQAALAPLNRGLARR
jgi:hypothetical protein